MKSIKIAGAALNQTPLDWAGNTANILSAIELAQKEAVHLLCLPELCITGYSCEDLFLGHWLAEKALTKLQAIIPHTENIAVAIGLPVIFENQLYNCAALVENGELLGISAKQHLALDGIHYEPRWFKAWPSGTQNSLTIDGKEVPFGDLTYTIKDCLVGVEICEDAWRADTRPAIHLQQQGVEIIINPSASHFSMGKSVLREELGLYSSSQYDCVYVYANLLGNEAGRILFDGEIMIAQDGRMLAKNSILSFKAVNLVAYTVYPGRTPEVCIGKSALIQQKEEEFTQSAALALFDYLRKSKSQGFVLSLSGGADSSTCAVLVAEMIKRALHEMDLKTFLHKIHQLQWLETLEENDPDLYKNLAARLLTCAYQGTKNSSEATFNAAKYLAEDVGAVFHHWLIDEEVAGYTSKVEKALNRPLSWEQDDITLQNIQARARSPIIWMFANIKNALLLTTSNRSEGSVGYTTMDGDTSGSIAPIAAIDKSFILHWLQWAEKKLHYHGLQHVNRLQPSAELRPGKEQTDEQDLMPYAVLNRIERLAIQQHHSPVAVFDILKVELNDYAPAILKQYIQKFFRLWSRNQWKRERLAPSFHLDDYNVDPRSWCRFPILSAGFQEELQILENMV